MDASSRTDRLLLAMSAVLAASAVVVRVVRVAVPPALADWDAPGHADYVLALSELRWPDPRSWCGAHPPLFYGLGAATCALLPDAVPMHVTLRLLSVAAWVVTLGLVWRALRPAVGSVDAAVATTVLLATPGFAIASAMMTNDALCALFVTATLARLLAAPPGVPRARDAAATGVLAGLAAASKATGMAAVGIGALWHAWRAWQARPRSTAGLAAVGAFALASAAFVLPHYLRLLGALSGSLYDILAVRAGSIEKETVATAVHEIARLTSTVPSFPRLVHTALWNDPTVLPHVVSTTVPARLAWIGGMLVTAIAAAGTIRILAHPALRRRTAVALLFGFVYLAALVPHAVDRPYIVLTKTNYLLPAALPLALVVASGLGLARGGLGTGVRVLVLAVAVACLTFTGSGATRSVAAAPVGAAEPGPADTVQRYFRYRVTDPIRTLTLLAPAEQLAHDLRLATLLQIALPPAPPGAPEADRQLELERARVAWLDLYNLVPWMQPAAAALRIAVLSVHEDGNGAEVNVAVGPSSVGRPPGVPLGAWPFPPFEQRFTLARDGTAWRITAIDQRGVVPENTLQAFVAHPTLARDSALRALGWLPGWEEGFDLLRRHGRS